MFMPELPEVETTKNGLKNNITGLRVLDIWTSYNSLYFKGSKTIKDPSYFKLFKKEVVGTTILSVERRAKNILINIDNEKTILIHMKMTGHLLYGLYKFNSKNKKDPWEPLSPEGLKDPFNRRVRFVITFDNGKYLALSDTRKFAKITLLETKEAHRSDHLQELGPEPLEKSFTFEKFLECIGKRSRSKIKQTLMDQTIISGIGNIYADESLWRAGIHPTRRVCDIRKADLRKLYEAIRLTLRKGIDLGGDSMSDYRNIDGNKGQFQEQHRAYRRTGEKCSKKGCVGTIKRIVLAGRATHFCDRHQF